MAQSELSNRSPIAWAMLVDQLARTLRAIGDAHAARGELGMATVLVDRLSSEVNGLHEQFEASTARELVPGERTQEDRVGQAAVEMYRRQRGHGRGRGPSQGRGIER